MSSITNNTQTFDIIGNLLDDVAKAIFEYITPQEHWESVVRVCPLWNKYSTEVLRPVFLSRLTEKEAELSTKIAPFLALTNRTIHFYCPQLQTIRSNKECSKALMRQIEDLTPQPITLRFGTPHIIEENGYDLFVGQLEVDLIRETATNSQFPALKMEIRTSINKLSQLSALDEQLRKEFTEVMNCSELDVKKFSAMLESVRALEQSDPTNRKEWAQLRKNLTTLFNSLSALKNAAERRELISVNLEAAKKRKEHIVNHAFLTLHKDENIWHCDGLSHFPIELFNLKINEKTKQIEGKEENVSFCFYLNNRLIEIFVEKTVSVDIARPLGFVCNFTPNNGYYIQELDEGNFPQPPKPEKQ